uniref:Thymidine kinase n=1 Tax=Bovine herpesvirus 1 (strain 6660) TaxID=10322 RepID=KITH_BHV16|nr:RecName: Full=Thymidine kinase [Bovine herpesvirus type 1 strain 6660]BAA00339.1 thymidine kinase [Bovine alphaherpesvirus 1]
MAEPARALRVVRIYLDGAHGLGKTTTGRALAAASTAGEGVLFFPEPMAYWRTMFGTDALSGILAASARCAAASHGSARARRAGAPRRRGRGGPGCVLPGQVRGPVLNFARARVRAAAPPGPAPGGTVTLVFDRHPVAACLCYPFARYCLREINAEDLLMLAAAMPPEAPGANLVVCTLPPAEQQRRLAARARPGDRADAGFLVAVRNAYALLVNTCAFLRAGGDGATAGTRWSGRTQMHWPRSQTPVVMNAKCAGAGLRDTLFAALKCRELYPGGGTGLPAVHAWALDALAGRLAALEVFVLDVSAAPDACAAAVLDMRPAMQAACADGAAGATLATLARQFALEMAGEATAGPRGL